MNKNNKLTKEEFFERFSMITYSEEQALNKLADELYHYSITS